MYNLGKNLKTIITTLGLGHDVRLIVQKNLYKMFLIMKEKKKQMHQFEWENNSIYAFRNSYDLDGTYIFEDCNLGVQNYFVFVVFRTLGIKKTLF